MSVAQVGSTTQSKQEFRIAPSNQPANGIFSHTANPTLSFDLPNSNVILNPKSLRLTGRMRIKAGTFGANTDNTRINQYLGVNSCFETCTWSSKNSRAILERIVNYPVLINSILPAIKDSASFRNEFGVECLASQSNAFCKKWIMPKLSVADGANPADGLDFSTPIVSGVSMCSGEKIPLMTIGGLTLTMNLAPNSAVFNTTDAISPEYELFDLALVGSYLVPSLEDREALAEEKEGMLELNTFTPLFSTVMSTAQTQTYSLGLSDVISVLWSFVPAVMINNYEFDQNTHMRLTQMTSTTSNQLVKVNSMRSGIQLPLLFDQNVTPGSTEAQLHRFYLMALKKIQDVTESAVSYETNDINFALGATGNLVTSANQLLDVNKMNVNYGLPYDLLGDYAGTSFQGEPLSLELTSTMSDNTSNAQYVFVLHKSKVMYDESGIRVLN